MLPVNIKDKLMKIKDYWNPKLIGELNNQHIKLAKFKGEFIWHKHENEDEMFYVIRGSFTMEFRDRIDLEDVYDALVLGARDYIKKNGFPGAIIGSSGGIDSALTAVIVADALGPENLKTYMMPYKYTADMSVEDAQELAQNLGIEHNIIDIESIFDAFYAALQEEFSGKELDKTEENLQSRCRGVLLMAISNKTGSLVMTTGNKSETAVGYSTLYGDTAGGFAVLKDVPKTLVYELANYRNSLSKAIPQRILDRPPSAELAPDQKDSDSLPDYDILDSIIELYVEGDKSHKEIIDELDKTNILTDSIVNDTLIKKEPTLLDKVKYKASDYVRIKKS